MADGPVVAFDIGVLLGFAGLDVFQADPTSGSPYL